MTASPSWDLKAEQELWADICCPGRHEHALYWFVKMAWGWHWRCTEPGQMNWFTKRVHQPWLDWVQSKVMEWKIMRRSGKTERMQIIICVPRGFGKSNIVTKTLPLWVSLDEPNMTCYIGSETHPKAKSFLAPIKSIMAGADPYSWFTWLYGDWYAPDRTWNNEEVVHAYRTSLGISEPSIGTFGVETGITSKHPLLAIYDDPVSDEKIDAGGSWISAALDSLDSIYPALRPDSLFILIGTRYQDDDPIGVSLDTEGVAEWVGHDPTHKIHTGLWHVYFLQARDLNNRTNFPKGEPTLPESGWTNEALLRYENKKAQKYAAQMMNDPTTGEHMEITREQINNLVMRRVDLPAIEYATLHIDTAFKVDERREHGDYTALVVWLHDLRPTGIVYLDRVLRSRKWRSEEFDTELLRVMFDLKRRGIRIRAISDEAEQGGKRLVYRQHLEAVISGAGLRIPEIYQFNRAGTRKVLRIREAASYWLDNCVRILDPCEGSEALIEEMLKIGRSRNDDCADAAADVWRPELWRGRSTTDVLPPMPTGSLDSLEALEKQVNDRAQNQFHQDAQKLMRELWPGQSNGEIDDPQPTISGESDNGYETFGFPTGENR